MSIERLSIEGFKAFQDKCDIEFSKMNLLFGANSSGKSSTIQALMLLKQTVESKSNQYDILPNGKYLNLGSAEDIINKNFGRSFSISVEVSNGLTNSSEINEISDKVNWNWDFRIDKNKINKASLYTIEAKNKSKKYNLHYNDKTGSFINKDKSSIIKEIDVKNMIPESVTLQYNSQYNKIINEFLSEIYDMANKGVKRSKWNQENIFRDEILRITECFLELASDQSSKDHTLSIKSSTVKSLYEFITEIEKKLYFSISKGILGPILTGTVLSLPSDDISRIELVIRKYKERLKNVANSPNDTFFNPKILLNESSKNEYFEDVRDLYQTKKSLIDTIDKINYLGPIRERPKSIYEHDSDQSPTYVGKNGQHLPSILAYFSNSIVTVPLPDTEEVQKVKFIDALNKWIKYLGIADDIEASISNYLTVNVKNEGVISNIVNVGVGVSQVLPVVAMGILSKKGDILIFEQPELHLHPYVQSKLIDFFIALANHGRQIIVESHSEYFLHRLRYKILNKDVSKEDVSVLFFNKTANGARVKKAELGEFGDIEYPLGFKDSTEELINQLLHKQLERLKNE